MQIEQLGYFIEVAKKGSINLACENLHISQQALSQSMRNLEKEMGLELMVRSHKGILLTEKGQELFRGAIEIVERWEILKAKLNEDWLSGKVTVSIAPLIEDHYYATLLDYIRKRHLHIQLETVNLHLNEAAVALEAGKIDLAAVCFLCGQMEPFLLGHPSLEFISKKQLNLTILVSKQSVLAKKAAICAKDLEGQSYILDKSTEQNIEIYQYLWEDQPTVEIIAVNSFYAKQKMVADNLGFTLNIENGPMLRDYENAIVNVPLEGVAPIVTGVLYNKNTPRKKFIEEILNAW